MAGVPLPPSTVGLQTPAIQAALLKGVGQQLPGAATLDPLQVGQVVAARIGLDPETGAPVLVLGGARLHAELPGNLQVGQALRLQVQESGPERVVLKVVADAAQVGEATPLGTSQQAGGPAQQASAVAPPIAAFPMPGGGQVRMWLDPDGGSSDADRTSRAERTRTMVVRYDSPVLGRTDVVLRLEPDQLDASVFAANGLPLELVRAMVPALRAALAGAVDRPVALQTGGRVPEEFDVRA